MSSHRKTGKSEYNFRWDDDSNDAFVYLIPISVVECEETTSGH